MMLFIFSSSHAVAQAQTNIDFSEETYECFSSKLDGEWLFYANELSVPRDVRSQLKLSEGKKVELPNSFQKNIEKGTYTTTITFPKSFIGKSIRFNIPFQLSSYKLYVNDDLIIKNGFDKQKFSRELLELKPLTPTFILEEENVQLTFQVLGFDDVSTGLNKSISIGNENLIERNVSGWAFMQAFLIGGILLVACISLSIFIYRKGNNAYLVFSLFSFASGIWGLFTDDYLYTIFYDKLDWITATRLTYILPMFVISFYVLYISKSFRHVISEKLMNAFQAILVVIILVCIFAPNGQYQQLFLVINSCLTPFYLYFIARTMMHVRWKDKAEVLTAIGVISIFAGSSHDMYILGTSQNGLQLAFIFIGVFIGIQSFILSYQFVLQWKKIEQLNSKLVDLNETLDEKIKIRTRQLEKSNSKLRSLAYLDGLTGAFNRHYFNKNLENIYQKYLEISEPIAVLILDVDEFKRYNDYYGHVRGDDLLKSLVAILTENLPCRAEFTRYGGEEFAVILDETTASEANEIAEKLRASIENAKLEHLGRTSRIVTISVGGVALETTKFNDVNDVLAKADEQLYLSKNNGRNKVNFKNLG